MIFSPAESRKTPGGKKNQPNSTFPHPLCTNVRLYEPASSKMIKNDVANICYLFATYQTLYQELYINLTLTITLWGR